jgi:hypothetical protein
MPSAALSVQKPCNDRVFYRTIAVWNDRQTILLLALSAFENRLTTNINLGQENLLTELVFPKESETRKTLLGAPALPPALAGSCHPVWVDGRASVFVAARGGAAGPAPASTVTGSGIEKAGIVRARTISYHVNSECGYK